MRDMPDIFLWTVGCLLWTAWKPREGKRDFHVAVIILTTFDEDEYIFQALNYGASGYLLKDAPPAK